MDKTLCTERNILYKKQKTILLFYLVLLKTLLSYCIHQAEEMQLKYMGLSINTFKQNSSPKVESSDIRELRFIRF